MFEAADVNLLAQLNPAIMGHQFIQEFFQGDAVEGIVGLRWCHELVIARASKKDKIYIGRSHSFYKEREGA